MLKYKKTIDEEYEKAVNHPAAQFSMSTRDQKPKAAPARLQKDKSNAEKTLGKSRIFEKGDLFYVTINV